MSAGPTEYLPGHARAVLQNRAMADLYLKATQRGDPADDAVIEACQGEGANELAWASKAAPRLSPTRRP